MKQCPRCNRNYADEALSFCLEDGTALIRKYDADATLINPNPPFPVVPPTVAYQQVPVTIPIYPTGPRPTTPVTLMTPARKSPWLIGLLVLLALGVGLAIGGFIFQRSSKPSPVSESLETARESVATQSTTPMPATSTSTPTPAQAEATTSSSTADQSTQVNGPVCVLYNDKSDKNVVNVRTNCDTRNCEMDASTIAGEYPDNTPVRVITGSNVQTSRFTWVNVIIVSSGRTVWVASSKIKCR